MLGVSYLGDGMANGCESINFTYSPVRPPTFGIQNSSTMPYDPMIIIFSKVLEIQLKFRANERTDAKWSESQKALIQCHIFNNIYIQLFPAVSFPFSSSNAIKTVWHFIPK